MASKESWVTWHGMCVFHLINAKGYSCRKFLSLLMLLNATGIYTVVLCTHITRGHLALLLRFIYLFSLSAAHYWYIQLALKSIKHFGCVCLWTFGFVNLNNLVFELQLRVSQYGQWGEGGKVMKSCSSHSFLFLSVPFTLKMASDL